MFRIKIIKIIKKKKKKKNNTSFKILNPNKKTECLLK